jgi:hypothetical protein
MEDHAMTDPNDQLRALERQLQLAHQSRRAAEHLLDGVRQALCDAGFMRDDDPYGHADLADVIRQAGKAPTVDEVPSALPSARKLIRDVLGYVSGCVYAMDRDYVEELTDRLWDLYCSPGEEMKPPAIPPCHIDHDCPGQVRQPPHCGCEAWDRGEAHPEHQWRTSAGRRVSCNGKPPSSWPTVSAEPSVPLTRAAVRTVVSFVGSLVGWIDEVHGDQVDQITDAALAKIGGPAPAACPNLPGHETHSPPCGFILRS